MRGMGGWPADGQDAASVRRIENGGEVLRHGRADEDDLTAGEIRVPAKVPHCQRMAVRTLAGHHPDHGALQGTFSYDADDDRRIWLP